MPRHFLCSAPLLIIATLSCSDSDPEAELTPDPDGVAITESGFQCPEGQRPALSAEEIAELGQDLTESAPSSVECEDVDRCSDLDCGSNGECVLNTGRAACRCAPGYTGAQCAECAWGFEDVAGQCQLPADCDTTACSGFGSCELSPEGRIACVCPEGIGGEFCERCADGFHNTSAGCVRTTSCEDEDCSGRGTCTQEGMVAVCACDSGWAGSECGTPCDTASCNGNGVCRPDSEGEAQCLCDAGYNTNEDCASCAPGFNVGATGGCLRDSSCDADTCNGRGSCSDAAGGVICTCNTGFDGDACEECADGYVATLSGDGCEPVESCPTDPCSGNGVCDASSGRAQCTCNEGYSGTLCDTFVPPTRVLRGRVPDSLSFGETTLVDLEVAGIGNFSRALSYELTSGPGRLVLDPDGGPPRYEAPTDDQSPGPAVITVLPIPPGPLGPAPLPPASGFSLTIPVIPPDSIPANGLGWAATEPLDNTIRDFMRYRCVGAAALTVMRNGTIIYRKGFGRTDGPASVAKFPGCGTDDEDPHQPSSGVIGSHTPFGLGSLSKAFAAAALRRLVEARMDQIGRSGDVEDQLILDPELNMLPADIRSVLNGTNPPYALEVPFVDNAPATGNDCDTEGTSFVVTNPLSCACRPGYSGLRCSYDETACAGTNANQDGTLPNAADTRWQEMTVGHLLSHRAGLPRNFSLTDFVLGNLAVIRNLSTQADWQAQQAALTTLLQARGLDDEMVVARSDLESEGIDDPFFVPWALPGENSIDELLTAYGSACLESRPGQQYAYSNWGYIIMGRIIERLDGERPYTALVGEPDTHPGSALSRFLAVEFQLGNGLASDYGIYADPQSVGVTLFNASKRRWTNTPATYYDTFSDRKWPVCSWDGTRCSFSDWLNGNNNVRFNAVWDRTEVSHWQGRTGVLNNGWAGLAAELPLYARMMERFWIGGYDESAGPDDAEPFMGEERAPGDLTREMHTGLVSGARAVAEYVGPGRDLVMRLPLVVDGRITDDASNTAFRNLVRYPPMGSSETCTIPSGLTYVFAVNNSSDKRCIAETGEGTTNAAVCSNEYGLMDNFVKFGLCQSDLNNAGYPPLKAVIPD